MNNISQISIFKYREIENLGDLEKLKKFFENIDDIDEKSYQQIKKKMGKSDDYFCFKEIELLMELR